MLTSSWQMRHIEQILVRARDGEEASPSHDGAAATPALDLASFAPIVLPDRLMGGERGKGASRARARGVRHKLQAHKSSSEGERA